MLDAGQLAGAAPDFLDVTLLAVLQGLTEFLPVSSSGHLVLAEHLLGLQEGNLALVVALHLGTLLAVLAVYRESLLGLLRDLVGGRPRAALLILLASVPAGLVGVLLEDWFEARFSDDRAAAFGLLGTALLLALAEGARRRRLRLQSPARELGAGGALAIGVAQAIAILPGISRSGATISAGLGLGLAAAEAARFSFLMSLVAIGGAALLQARKLFGAEEALTTGVPLIAWGVLLSALVGWGALRFLLAFLGRGAFGWFSLYCAVLGLAWLGLA